MSHPAPARIFPSMPSKRNFGAPANLETASSSPEGGMARKQPRLCFEARVFVSVSENRLLCQKMDNKYGANALPCVHQVFSLRGILSI